MFLQKYQYQLPQRNSLMLNKNISKHRIEDATKRISTSQLRGHQNKHNYSDPRKFLIENTQKVITQKNHTPTELKTPAKRYLEKGHTSNNHRLNLSKQKYDLSKREDRILAAKKYRERIWKSSDISNLIRAQQQLIQSRKTERFRNSSYETVEKVIRYHDFLKQFGDKGSTAEKQKLKRQSMAFTFIGNKTQHVKNRLNSNPKNPQLQVTNIQFVNIQQLVKNPIKILMNRDRRKQMIRRTTQMTSSSLSKRPNTTGNMSNKYEQNFIEPW